MGDQRVDPVAGARHGAIDPLARQKKRPGDALRIAEVRQGPTDRVWIGEGGEMIKRADREHMRALRRPPGTINRR